MIVLVTMHLIPVASTALAKSASAESIIKVPQIGA
jgi:hypothetical protein